MHIDVAGGVRRVGHEAGRADERSGVPDLSRHSGNGYRGLVFGKRIGDGGNGDRSGWLFFASLQSWGGAMRKRYHPFAAVALIGTALLWPVRSIADGQDWSDFNGNAMAQKYSTAAQITPANIMHLAVAWSVHTGDVSEGGPGRGPKTAWQSTPLFVNNMLYISTPRYRVFAVAPDTGKVKWIYAAKTISNDAKSKFHGTNRGIAYWAAANPVGDQPCQKILYLGTVE